MVRTLRGQGPTVLESDPRCDSLASDWACGGNLISRTGGKCCLLE